MTARARFRQADVTKAVNGALEAGLRPTRISIEPDGKIILEFDQPIPESPYDKYKRTQAARSVELE